MALNAEMGQLTIPTSTGTQQITHSVTNLSALIFFGGLSTGAAVGADHMVGFSDGSNEYSVGRWLEDGATLPDTSKSSSGPRAAAIFHRHGATVQYSATVSDITSSYFELTWATIAAAAQSKKINWIAIGGVDAKVGYLALNTTTGNQSDTSLSFQGDFGLFLSINQVSFTSYSNGTCQFGLGLVEDASNEGAIYHYNRTSTSTTSAKSYLKTDRCYVVGGTSLVADAEFMSWNADGYTINITDAPPSAYVMPYLILNTGGNRSVGTFNQATATGEQTVESGLGFDSIFSLFAGRQETSGAAVSSGRFFFGGGKNTSGQGCSWSGSQHGSASPAADQRISTVRCIEQYTEGTPTELADASYINQAANSVQVDWDTVDATERQILYAILGVPGAPPSGIVPFRRRIEGY